MRNLPRTTVFSGSIRAQDDLDVTDSPTILVFFWVDFSSRTGVFAAKHTTYDSCARKIVLRLTESSKIFCYIQAQFNFWGGQEKSVLCFLVQCHRLVFRGFSFLLKYLHFGLLGRMFTVLCRTNTDGSEYWVPSTIIFALKSPIRAKTTIHRQPQITQSHATPLRSRNSQNQPPNRQEHF